MLLLRRRPELLPMAGPICELSRRAAEQALAAFASSLTESEPGASPPAASAVAGAGPAAVQQSQVATHALAGNLSR
jgi:hypothetical protein